MISIARLMDTLRLTEPLDVPQLERTVDAVIAEIEGQTGRYFGPRTATQEYHRGNGTRDLQLRSIPFADETGDDIAVTERLLGSTSAVVDQDAATGYELRRGRRLAWLRRTGSAFWTMGHEYVVAYEHGYAVDGLPADIDQLVLFRVKQRFHGLTLGGGIRSETIGPITTTYQDGSGFTAAIDEVGIIQAWSTMVFA